MVVNNLDLPRFPIAPNEADTPSVIDANTVLTSAVRPQSFETIARRCVQIAKPTGRVNRQQLRPRSLLELHGYAANSMTCEDRRSALVRKALDHTST